MSSEVKSCDCTEQWIGCGDELDGNLAQAICKKELQEAIKRSMDAGGHTAPFALFLRLMI